MPRPSRWRLTGCSVLTVLAALAVLVACRSGEATPAGGRPPGDALVVSSFDFPESELLAEIYATALEHSGVEVRRELAVGPRELLQPALRQGLVDLVPEYLGSALAAVAPDDPTDRADVEAMSAALGRALVPWHVIVLRPSPAQDQNGLAVTTETAARLSLRRISDLGTVAHQLTLTGPPECPTRRYCLVGLADVYGVSFARFLPYATESQRVAALEEGLAEVAVVFSSDGRLGTGNFVLLEDDRGLQPAENVIPLLTRRALDRWGTGAAATIDAVSARLTSNALTFLNWRVSIAGREPAHEARGWLTRQGLAPAAS